jgi:leucyl-tRNA synthetase
MAYQLTSLALVMYDHKKIESKWQKFWEKEQSNRADDSSKKPKYYVLDMFPYPSGAGLHVGHPEGYTATDIISRYKRMNGFNVLHPMGWDAFGLPAENYAIKTGVDPETSTNSNIANFTKQIKALGFSYDWEREISTCSPEYYKWTQWFFLFLYNNGLAYKKEAPVNWCENDKTVLANEQVVQGKCERCGNEVIQKKLSQWFFKITDFIEDNGRTKGLLSGLDTIDWPDSTKISQRNWIGKSEGAEVEFGIENSKEKITVYTTRIDTLFSGTFMVLAPENELVNKITTPEQKKAVEKYIEDTKKKTDMQRTELNKDKNGVFTGAYAINPASGEKMPIWIADFVLITYGSGAVFADAHDERDFEMAKKYKIPLKVSIRPESDELWKKVQDLEECYPDDGILVNSGQFDGLTSKEARTKITEWLEKEGKAKKKTQYRLRDWLVSRQRYWGAPIPIVFDPEGKPHAVKEEHLPLMLPTDVDYRPKGTAPLGSSKEYVERAEKLYGKGWRFEIDTMDTFVCSSWYFFRYCDPKNESEFASKKLMKQWLPVDLYVGGAEHTVLHLLYSRFFTKALHKHGYTDFDEPFMKLRHQGLILGEDGEKMSKSRGNVINPDDVISKYGADALRLYEMFMGPFEQMKPWSMNGVEGVYRFLQKVWRLSEKNMVDTEMSAETANIVHKSIKKVEDDINGFSFNTAISQMMICVNELTKLDSLPREAFEILLKILSPFAPHIAEELWSNLGNKKSIFMESWPAFNAELAKDSEVEIAVQINGKLRGTFKASPEISQENALKQAKELESVSKYLDGVKIIKEIYIPSKIVSFVVRNEE